MTARNDSPRYLRLYELLVNSNFLVFALAAVNFDPIAWRMAPLDAHDLCAEKSGKKYFINIFDMYASKGLNIKWIKWQQITFWYSQNKWETRSVQGQITPPPLFWINAIFIMMWLWPWWLTSDQRLDIPSGTSRTIFVPGMSIWYFFS